MKKIYCLIFLLLSVLTACTEEVMKELKSDTFDPKLTTEFWNKEIAENTELWKQALPYCQDNPLKVNCINVRKAWTRYTANQRLLAQAQSRPIRVIRRPLLRRPHVIIVETN